MSIRLYVGNLPKDLEREEFEAVFAEESENLVSIKLIADRKTGKCRGFGFVTAKTEEVADALVEKYNGHTVQDSALKVEKAMPRSDSSESSDRGGSRRSSKKGSDRRSSSSSPADSAAAAQPDPRWAQDLAKLKEMLATQTTAS
ncbi:RNA-binding protein [Romeria aff. gracilis LEGE 07310]|uniref:RNA-binding protein n=1 Tax=Vasconcelosia minhoensis LEGE 07310 TaxID=915328 RepID=A0A8J7DLT0_9CYAN|nr:RNA-binding protein [Romeria gracilis]MBE9077616.1 RNA-binding protein [Romeria aff. gracilis LEGE 07310]